MNDTKEYGRPTNTLIHSTESDRAAYGGRGQGPVLQNSSVDGIRCKQLRAF